MAFVTLVHNGRIDRGQVHVGILGSSLVNRRHGVQGGEQAGSAGNHLGHVGGTLVSGHEIGVDQALGVPLVHNGDILFPSVHVGPKVNLASLVQLPAVEHIQAARHGAELAVAAAEVQD